MNYKNTPACRLDRKKLFASASLFLLMIVLSSCGIWTDFTTYFNTYYNAKTLFDQTEEEVLKQKKDMFAFREEQQPNLQYGVQPNPQAGYQYGAQTNTQLGVQTNTQVGTQTGTQYSGVPQGVQLTGSLSQNLTKVIEKCSKILQYETNSSYFPDALFMTGKAFFYMQEYAKAQRKFLELANLGETKYSLENKLWLAKTYLQLRSFDEGLKLIEDVKADAIKNDKEQLFDDASIAKVSFFIFREEYLKAADECKNYLSVSKNDESNALVCYELGKIYLKLSDEQNALQAFSSVPKYSPTVEIEFRSRIEYCRLLKQLNRIDECESALETLRYQGKFKNYLDEILIERGEIYDDKDQPKLAVDLYRDVDSTYRQSPSSGIASMKLGEIYERRYRDYDSSYKYYKKVALSLAPREMKTRSDNRARNFEKYFQIKNQLDDYNLKITYLKNPSRYLQDSLDYDFAYRQYQDENRRLAEGQTNQMNQAQTQQELNNEFIQRQKAMLQQQTNLKDTKNIPLKTLIAQGRAKKPERPNFSVDSVNTLVAQEMYNLGSNFFSELNVPDSAAFYFKEILKDYSNKPVKVQTMYALGTYYQTVNDTVRADSLFKYIYDNFPKNLLSNAAAEKLGLVKQEKIITIAKNIDPAEKFYIEAEKIYYEKKYEAAIDSFRNIYKNYPTSLYAPKSVYYIGLIYEDDLKMLDSAAAAYGKLTKDYTKSPLVNLVMAKYSEFMNEKEKQKREAEAKQKEAVLKQKEAEEKLKVSQAQNKMVQQKAVSDSSRVKENDEVREEQKQPANLNPKIEPDTTKKQSPILK